MHLTDAYHPPLKLKTDLAPLIEFTQLYRNTPLIRWHGATTWTLLPKNTDVFSTIHLSAYAIWDVKHVN